MVATPTVLIVMLLSGLFGMFVGAVPGLTATMATALLVPHHLLPAAGARGGGDRHGHRDGDLRGRHPGRAAAHSRHAGLGRLHRRVLRDDAQGPGRDGARHRAWCSPCIGGLFGTAVLIVAAPALAEVAIKFSSFEYFWLVLLGLTCAVFIASDTPLKGLVTLFLGLLLALRRARKPGRPSALHLRQRRPAGRPEPDPRDDRHVRHLRDPALHAARRDSSRSSRSRSARCSPAWAA